MLGFEKVLVDDIKIGIKKELSKMGSKDDKIRLFERSE